MIVASDEMPNMPHVELERAGHYAMAKIKEGSFQNDTARELDRIASHGIAAGRRRLLIATSNRLRQIGMQTGDLREVAEPVAVNEEKAARERMQR